MLDPQFTVTQTESKGNYAKFVIEPLPQGFGHTLGNSLRRVLYSSIPGASITSLTIAGANHQFSSLEGVSEDVVKLVLSLKQLRVSYTGEKPTKISLSAKGPGEVTAAQFELPGDVKIANPELIIAHLTDKSTKLDIEAVVESGLGYSPAEERKSTTVGVIPIDASFTPVVRVNYTVEATRVGRVTNFDKLVLEITTDGTIDAKLALETASKILVNYFSAVSNPQTSSSSVTTFSGVRVGGGASLAVEELDLPTRIANALQKAGMETVAQLQAVPKAELAKVKNLGTKSVKIIEVALRERGLELAQ